MITTMDSAGRIVIPSEVRREADIVPGEPVDVRWRDGLIEIEPRPTPVTFERRGHLLVAKASRRMPKLRGAVVDRTRRNLLARRGGR